MKHDLKKRIQTLEEGTKPRVLSTLLDLINCIEENEDVELSPELQELVEMQQMRLTEPPLFSINRYA
jgi:hypothetical protein